jgi:hypothetical protein
MYRSYKVIASRGLSYIKLSDYQTSVRHGQCFGSYSRAHIESYDKFLDDADNVEIVLELVVKKEKKSAAAESSKGKMIQISGVRRFP